jgi:succinate dehydrogenase / fumarate reductase, cytochrome b subunit
MEAARRPLLRRLHSIAGVVPVGAFLLFHLYVNAQAARGADAYNAMAARLQALPLAVALELFVIALPIFFHGIYGLFVTATEPPGDGRPGRGRRALSIFQRITGILLFGFILFHLWTARLVQVRDHESLDLFRLMQAVLSSPWMHAAYVAGLLGATAHFSAGLFTFADTWGLARGRQARVAVGVAAILVFLALTGLGLRSIAAFRL